MTTGTTLMEKNDRKAPARNRQADRPEEQQEVTLVPMLIWGLALIIIGMVFAVLVS
jgi:hypothetical protein